MFDDLYCKIFVDTDESINVFSEQIGVIISGKEDKFHSFEGEFYTLDIHTNKEYNKEKSDEFPDGFLYFKYNIEIDCLDTNKIETYIGFVSMILKSIWELGMKAVASCDFEKLLPNQGGYKKRINY